MNALKILIRRPAKIVSACNRPSFEQLEARELLSTPGVLTIANAECARDSRWFKGDDLPTVDVGGATNQKSAGTLFGPIGPQASGEAQGAVGDCSFPANLAEAAQQSPQPFRNVFTDNSDGTYTVRFYGDNSMPRSITSI
jgi:hypothetical protein